MAKWWGYKHTDGSVHAKRYFDEGDLAEARSSDFVGKLCPPFEAESSGDAIEYLFAFFKPKDADSQDSDEAA